MGGDFNSYVHNVYLTTKKQWMANVPPTVKSGERGKDFAMNALVALNYLTRVLDAVEAKQEGKQYVGLIDFSEGNLWIAGKCRLSKSKRYCLRR